MEGYIQRQTYTKEYIYRKTYLEIDPNKKIYRNRYIKSKT